MSELLVGAAGKGKMSAVRRVTDGTETSCPFSRVGKYGIRCNRTPSWLENGFYEELKEQILQILAENGATKLRTLIADQSTIERLRLRIRGRIKYTVNNSVPEDVIYVNHIA